MIIIQVNNKVFIVFLAEEILLDTNASSISTFFKRIGLLWWQFFISISISPNVKTLYSFLSVIKKFYVL